MCRRLRSEVRFRLPGAHLQPFRDTCIDSTVPPASSPQIQLLTGAGDRNGVGVTGRFGPFQNLLTYS